MEYSLADLDNEEIQLKIRQPKIPMKMTAAVDTGLFAGRAGSAVVAKNWAPHDWQNTVLALFCALQRAQKVIRAATGVFASW